MSGITLDIAKEHLNAWLKAELEVTASQSYEIGTRSLTRANLGEIRKQIEYWKNQVAKLENIARNRGRNRAYRAVPRDL